MSWKADIAICPIRFRLVKTLINRTYGYIYRGFGFVSHNDRGLTAAVAELIALREQMPATQKDKPEEDYDPQDRSLANTMRALRKCMRQLNKYCDPEDGLLVQLSQATVQRYDNKTDKRARYRPKNPDKKPLGDPVVRKMNAEERERLIHHQHNQREAA